jgi:hypothetical protein
MSEELKDAEIDHLRFRNKDAEAAVEIGIAALESKNALIRDLVQVLRDIRGTYQPVTTPMLRIINEALIRAKAEGYEP